MAKNIPLAEIKTLKDAEKFLRQRFKPFEFFNARHTFPDCDDFSGYQSCLLGAMQRVTWETDKHIALFLKSEKWPELSSIEKFSCQCRLLSASKTLRLLK